jgi:hypothetical protein
VTELEDTEASEARQYRNHASYGPLTKILIGVAVILSICCGYLAFSVTDQADKIEALEDQVDRIETETNRIGKIADRVSEPSTPSPELQEVFRQISEMYQVIVEDGAATEGE